MIFKKKKRIRFHHCDPAGIVFYPQYLVLCNEIVEDWLAEGIGVALEELIHERRRGLPMRHLEAEFLMPSQHGDELEFQLSVLRLGGSSINLAIEAWGENGLRFFSQQTMIWSDLEGPKPRRIEDDWREKFSRYMKSNPAEETE